MFSFAMLCTVCLVTAGSQKERTAPPELPLPQHFSSEDGARSRHVAPWTFVRPFWAVTVVYDTPALTSFHDDRGSEGHSSHIIIVDCRSGVARVAAQMDIQAIPESIRETDAGVCRIGFANRSDSLDVSLDTGVTTSVATVDPDAYRISCVFQLHPKYVRLIPNGVAIGSAEERLDLLLDETPVRRGVAELWNKSDRRRRLGAGPLGEDGFVIFNGLCDGDLDGPYTSVTVSAHLLEHPKEELWRLTEDELLDDDERLIELGSVQTPGVSKTRAIWQCVVESRGQVFGRLVEFTKDAPRIERLVDFPVHRLVLMRERQMAPTLSVDGSAVYLMKDDNEAMYRFDVSKRTFSTVVLVDPYSIKKCVVGLADNSVVAGTLFGQVVGWRVMENGELGQSFEFDPLTRP